MAVRTQILIALCAMFAGLGAAAATPAHERVRDLVIHEGDVPVRLVGYGLVTGLNGTGDRSFGGIGSQSATVHSVVNLLRRFGLEVPPDYLRLRNVAAVLVTAEVSPYLRAGGRFEVQVSALGDATSLDGGVLWMTPLVTGPGQPPVATAQGTLLISAPGTSRAYRARRDNAGRIPDGGVLEVDNPPAVGASPRLLLRRPDHQTAGRIAAAVNAAFGDGAATVEDQGAVRLTPNGEGGTAAFLAAVDTVVVAVERVARVVINGSDGTVVTGGEIHVGPAIIHHHGITLQIGGDVGLGGSSAPGLVQAAPDALVQDVTSGLHAAGADSEEIAAMLEALRAAGALDAEVVVR
jgi:flagellar P-ring protein precursor FlgI